ncbi:MAG: RNA-binding protein [Candidatus Margulisiibacteriota bacterium]
MNIYVGNIDRKVTEEELRQAFEEFGAVSTVSIIKDKFTGESRGFGFVEMASKEEAQTAMTSLNGKEFKGRTLTANEARPKTSNGDAGNRRPSNGGSNGNRSGGGFGGGSSRGARW